MTLRDVREVFVAQDRLNGSFFDINMTEVTSLKHAARADSESIVRETMQHAILEGLIECPDGYDVHSFFELRDRWDR